MDRYQKAQKFGVAIEAREDFIITKIAVVAEIVAQTEVAIEVATAAAVEAIDHQAGVMIKQGVAVDIDNTAVLVAVTSAREAQIITTWGL